ncbi:Protein SMG5 [Bagarius yarrelli]|uniref:Nonsense-mediated mRNA decay factor n=1 Tax=Bagarius yarrelli TaxID=175774 RepID=A0A556TLP8_BAGYA|nr:Protein SMG5 [Bagarius yarrelli]
MSGPGQDSEPEAKILHIKRLYRAVVESVHKLDVIVGSKSSYREVFKPENISLRNKLRELCVKLMFLHPVDYGRKAEELLWRKVYYEVIQVIKTNKKHIHSRSALECAYRTHLIAGVGFYQHLLLYIQSHYQLELQDCIDWTHVTDPLIGRKKPVSASPKEMEWAQMACHRCLVYLGDLARYQNELAGVEAEQLAERFYHQALSVSPTVGMPFNQLGTLAGSKFYNVEATYYYLRCIQSETPFEGAYGNLKRLFDKALKMHHQMKKQEMKKLSPSRQRSKDIKRLLVSFMYLQSLLQPKNSVMDTELTSLCQAVLEDFNLVLFYQPASSHGSQSVSEEEDEHDQAFSVLPDSLVFKVVVICLMVVHSLKRGGSKQYSTSIAFTLALFSHLVNHVNIRLQAELEQGESDVPPLRTDAADDGDSREQTNTLTSEGRQLQNGSVEEEDGDDENDEDDPKGDGSLVSNKGSTKKSSEDEKPKQKRKYSRLSMLRRRRCARNEDESDLSEGFESDEEEDEEPQRTDTSEDRTNISPGKEGHRDTPREEGVWASGSEEEEEEEGGTAFDVETDSDMNSQESRSDLEDMASPVQDHQHVEEEEEEKAHPSPDEGSTPPATNGPLLSSDPSISSNLQAMSSQLFQAKRCFRLAPTFSNVLLKPSHASNTTSDPVPSREATPIPGDTPGITSPEIANGTNDDDADTEDSENSNQSYHSEKTLSERLEILTNQSLIQAVKVFVDWLRTNTDIILMCAQSSQSLWNRLSVLLNLLPDGKKVLEAGEWNALVYRIVSLHDEFGDSNQCCCVSDLCLKKEVRELLAWSEQPDLKQTVLLPEDQALRHLPALNLAHRRLDFTQHRTGLTPLQECVVRLCCIRSFGHFLTGLQGNVLHYNPEAGIFTSIGQSEQDNTAEEEARRNRLMRDMAQLRLQPKAQSSMSPYLVPDTGALCQHLNLLRQLAASGCFIIIIPRTVIDGLDVLKKENPGARDGIRFLESEFRKGNRYIRCQKESGRSFERDKLKRQDMESGGDEDTAGMVTILTANAVDELTGSSAHMKAVLPGNSGGFDHCRPAQPGTHRCVQRRRVCCRPVLRAPNLAAECARRHRTPQPGSPATSAATAAAKDE